MVSPWRPTLRCWCCWRIIGIIDLWCCLLLIEDQWCLTYIVSSCFFYQHISYNSPVLTSLSMIVTHTHIMKPVTTHLLQFSILKWMWLSLCENVSIPFYSPNRIRCTDPGGCYLGQIRCALLCQFPWSGFGSHDPRCQNVVPEETGHGGYISQHWPQKYCSLKNMNIYNTNKWMNWMNWVAPCFTFKA